MVLGTLLALGASFGGSVRETLQKHLTEDFTSLQMAFMGQVLGLLPLTVLAPFVLRGSSFTVNPWIVAALGISSGSTLIAVYLFFEALQGEDLSVVSPLRQVNPVIVAILEPLALGTLLEPMTGLGALASTAGAYVLVASNGLKAPLENLRNREAQLVLLVALIYAGASVARRFGTTATDPFAFLYTTWVLTTSGFTVWIYRRNELPGRKSFLRGDVLSMSLVTVLSVSIGFFALSLISATRYTVIKQLSGIFSVLIGGKVFSEQDLGRKMIGAVLILVGVAAATI